MSPVDGSGMRAGRPRTALRRASWLGLGLTVGALALLAWSFAGFVSRIDQSEAPPGRHAEGAVALTGGADRIADAIDLLATGRVDRLLITGVNPMTSRAEMVRQQPAARAFFDCCIELGYEAANTVGNATETQRWVRAHQIRTLVVVTSNYHMPRALAEIGSAVPDIDLIAYPVVSDRNRSRPWWIDPQSARLVVSEYVKYLATLTRLRLLPRPAVPRQEASLPADPMPGPVR